MDRKPIQEHPSLRRSEVRVRRGAVNQNLDQVQCLSQSYFRGEQGGRLIHMAFIQIICLRLSVYLTAGSNPLTLMLIILSPAANKSSSCVTATVPKQTHLLNDDGWDLTKSLWKAGENSAQMNVAKLAQAAWEMAFRIINHEKRLWSPDQSQFRTSDRDIMSAC